MQTDDAACLRGLACESLSQSCAYMKENVGCATAFSNTFAIEACSTSASLMMSMICCSSLSKFSGVSLLSIPLTCLAACKHQGIRLRLLALED